MIIQYKGLKKECKESPSFYYRMIREKLPDLHPDKQEALLWVHTLYPYGTDEMVKRRLEELIDKILEVKDDHLEARK